VSGWGASTYGDPCRECGFRWSIAPHEASALVAETPSKLRQTLSEADGSERHAELRWSVTAYVSHIADNLRIWAERLAAISAGDRRPVPPYDDNLLAEARRYNDLSLPGALWSLDRAVKEWLEAVEIAGVAGIVLEHPDRGEQTLDDVIRSNAHDACHHQWDVERTLESVE